MKAIAKIGPIAEYLIDPQILEELGEILPEGVQGDTFECELPDEDPCHAAIIDCLEQWAFEPEPWWEVDDDLGELNLYPYVIQRHYEAADFGNSAYLQPRPTVSFGNKTSPPGILHLQADSIPSGEDIGIMRSYIVVSDRLKGLIERAGLKGFVFRETRIHGRERTGLRGEYWELTSDLILPAVAPPCTVLDALGEPFAGDYEYGCYLHEGRYQPPELHYLASEVESLGAFDFAITNERFGPDDHAQHHLVTSQRFYQFCVENALKVDWVPVRVDAA
ncbi:MAG: hypothetical protein HY318_00290 [Armatimonadetes bacterium]|nr:hypothetical protein [Armatimonadota bacterium]